MIVVMEPHAREEHVEGVARKLRSLGFDVHLSRGVEKTIIGAVGSQREAALHAVEVLPGVERIIPILQPYKLAGREFKPEDTVVTVGEARFGGPELVIIAGPCAVESREQLLATAAFVRSCGATMLRGGAFKPRTSPYSFQGLEEEGLAILAEAREKTGMRVVTEVINPRDVELVSGFADMLQVGARNMQNFTLLREVGRVDKPVLLKRGLAATMEEWLMAAEYVMSSGNKDVVLCERGIRTYETYTRNTLDISAIPSIKRLSHLPIVVDPSHGTGKWRLVTPMARAAVAAGADGLMVEVHPYPQEALSDGAQSLTLDNFASLVSEIRPVAEAVGRTVRRPSQAPDSESGR